jgi:hypothetical protein
MTWKSMREPLKLGSLPTSNDGKHTYPIKGLPENPEEILVYLWIGTGNDNSDSDRHFEVASQLDRNTEVYVKLYAHAYTQAAWAYNSDNVWLPMPFDNEITIELQGKPISGVVNSGIEIIGYKVKE